MIRRSIIAVAAVIAFSAAAASTQAFAGAEDAAALPAVDTFAAHADAVPPAAALSSRRP